MGSGFSSEASEHAAKRWLVKPRLGELLLRKGLLTETQLAGALEEARESNELLGIVLLRRQVIFEEELARTLSEQFAIPYISIARVGFDQSAARQLPGDVGLKAAAIPVRWIGDTLQVAFADPTDQGALDAVRAHLPKIEIAVSELSDIRTAWRTVLSR